MCLGEVFDPLCRNVLFPAQCCQCVKSRLVVSLFSKTTCGCRGLVMITGCPNCSSGHCVMQASQIHNILNVLQSITENSFNGHSPSLYTPSLCLPLPFPSFSLSYYSLLTTHTSPLSFPLHLLPSHIHLLPSPSLSISSPLPPSSTHLLPSPSLSISSSLPLISSPFPPSPSPPLSFPLHLLPSHIHLLPSPSLSISSPLPPSPSPPLLCYPSWPFIIPGGQAPMMSLIMMLSSMWMQTKQWFF